MPTLRPSTSQALSVVDILLLEPPSSTCPGFIHDTTPLLKGTTPVVTELEALFGAMLGAASHQREQSASSPCETTEAGRLEEDLANDAGQVAELMQVWCLSCILWELFAICT
jgi:hypothetical protein